MDQIWIPHQSAPANALLKLVADQLDVPAGLLTLHGPEGAPPRILTSLNMPGSLAEATAASVDYDLWAAAGMNGRHNDHGLARMTFVHRAPGLRSIALTICPTEHPPRGSDDPAFQKSTGWIEPILGLIWQAEHEHALREGLMRAVDRFDFGIVLLDADGLPWFANAWAQRLLDSGEGIRRAGHAIAATDFEDSIRLQTAIRHDSGSCENFHVLMLRRGRTPPLIAVVASLGCRQSSGSFSATALYLIDPERDSRSMASALCRALGLTAMESTLAVHLVGGATVDDAASRMHIQKQTARAYLKQVFAKTGAHRQAELVRIILSGLVHIG